MAKTQEDKQAPAAAVQQSQGKEDWEKDFGGADISQAEIDGWYNVGIGKLKDEPIRGQIVGTKETTNDNGRTLNMLIRLSHPAHAISANPKQNPGELVQLGNDSVENVVLLPAGAVLAVRASYGLDSLLDYVAHKCTVAFKPTDKIKLNGGRTMWKYKVLIGKGSKKGPRPVLSSNAIDPTENDDIPF